MPASAVVGIDDDAAVVERRGKSRPYFARLRALAAENGLRHLSMGMSHDLEVAIQEGATILRVGTALFGPREKARPAQESGVIKNE